MRCSAKKIKRFRSQRHDSVHLSSVHTDYIYFLVVLLRCCYGFHRINTDDIYASQVYYEASLKTLADSAVNVAVLTIFSSQTISYF